MPSMHYTMYVKGLLFLVGCLPRRFGRREQFFMLFGRGRRRRQGRWYHFRFHLGNLGFLSLKLLYTHTILAHTHTRVLQGEFINVLYSRSRALIRGKYCKVSIFFALCVRYCLPFYRCLLLYHLLTSLGAIQPFFQVHHFGFFFFFSTFFSAKHIAISGV